MLIIIHENGRRVEEIVLNNTAIPPVHRELSREFWRLAGEYPDELLIWIDKRFKSQLNTAEIEKIFRHDLVMVSFAVKEQFFPPTIGYVDQLPFVNPDYNTLYPSWLMSVNVGGIKAGTALRFEGLINKKDSFGYAINSIAKIGQQNSLFCYSDPFLINQKPDGHQHKYDATTAELFNFVYQFYKTEWLPVLLFCYIKSEKRFPLLSFLSAFFSKKLFNPEVQLDSIRSGSSVNTLEEKESVDVIIPTLKRPAYVEQVLKDLKKQSLVPKKVIIIEQDPDEGAVSQLENLWHQNWPFQIEHSFIKTAGACKARNLALQKVSSKWIFFADDDIRISPQTLEDAVSESNRLAIHALNMNCLQPEGTTTFHKIKQWGAFGSGTSLVKSEYALQCTFNEAYEYGFGEDTDYGLQLRAVGADIVYHPDVQITHLKAERGGFRQEVKIPWEQDSLRPKPSPTMMLLVKTHYNRYMLKGYKVSLFLKFYTRQTIKNPFKYFKMMEKKWILSEQRAKELSFPQKSTKAR